MDSDSPAFKRGAVRPIVCLKDGWALIKDQYWLLLGMSVVGIFVGGMAPLGILLGPMMCGLHLAFFRRSQKELVKFQDLTRGFDYFVQSLIATLIQVVPMIILLAPVYLVAAFMFMGMMSRSAGSHGTGSPPELLPIIFLYGALLAVVLVFSLISGTLFLFTYPLIVDKKLSGVDAVKGSVRAAFANLGGVFSLTLLITLLGFVGMLFCYVGGLLVMPGGLAAAHIAYKQVFGSGNHD